MSNDQIAKPLIVEILGEHYEFTPLKIADITGPVTDYFQTAPIASLLAQRDAFEPEVFEEMLAEVKRESKGIEIGTQKFSDELNKPRNLFYMFWLSLRKKHPQIKKKEFDDMVQKDVDAVKVLLENLSRIIAIVDSEPKEGEEKQEGTREGSGTKKKIDPST